MASDKPRRSSRRLVLGIVLGLGAGLFVDALLAVWLRATLLYIVLCSLGLVLIVPVAAGIALGILYGARSATREPSWPFLILLAVVLWPAAVAAPFGARMMQMRFIANAAVPVYPGARSDKTAVELGDGEYRNDRVRLTFHAMADSSSILTFYRDELASRGWEAGPQHLINLRIDGTPHWFRHKKKFAFIHIRFRRLNQDGTLAYDVLYGL